MLRVYAGLLALEGRHQEAVEIIRRYPLADSDGYLPYVLAGSCLAVGDLPRARQLISRALELEPNQPRYQQLRDSLLNLDKP